MMSLEASKQRIRGAARPRRKNHSLSPSPLTPAAAPSQPGVFTSDQIAQLRSYIHGDVSKVVFKAEDGTTPLDLKHPTTGLSYCWIYNTRSGCRDAECQRKKGHSLVAARRLKALPPAAQAWAWARGGWHFHGQDALTFEQALEKVKSANGQALALVKKNKEELKYLEKKRLIMCKSNVFNRYFYIRFKIRFRKRE